MNGGGCEIRVDNLDFSVQRPKGSTDEPTVGDKFMGIGQCLVCLPLINRLTKGKVSADFTAGRALSGVVLSLLALVRRDCTPTSADHRTSECSPQKLFVLLWVRLAFPLFNGQ